MELFHCIVLFCAEFRTELVQQIVILFTLQCRFCMVIHFPSCAVWSVTFRSCVFLRRPLDMRRALVNRRHVRLWLRTMMDRIVYVKRILPSA